MRSPSRGQCRRAAVLTWPPRLAYCSAIPFYESKLKMAQARSRSTLVLNQDPGTVKSVMKRQQAAAQLVASGAVTAVDRQSGKATVRSSKEGNEYSVSVTTNDLACTCEDRQKGSICKHIRATISVFGMADRYVARRTGPLHRENVSYPHWNVIRFTCAPLASSSWTRTSPSQSGARQGCMQRTCVSPRRARHQQHRWPRKRRLRRRHSLSLRMRAKPRASGWTLPGSMSARSSRSWGSSPSRLLAWHPYSSRLRRCCGLTAAAASYSPWPSGGLWSRRRPSKWPLTALYASSVGRAGPSHRARSSTSFRRRR